MSERILLTHDPTEKNLPWTAEIHKGNLATGVRGFGSTKDEALAVVREKWGAMADKQRDEWHDL